VLLLLVVVGFLVVVVVLLLLRLVVVVVGLLVLRACDVAPGGHGPPFRQQPGAQGRALPPRGSTGIIDAAIRHK
jgi:hypothetical protein